MTSKKTGRSTIKVEDEEYSADFGASGFLVDQVHTCTVEQINSGFVRPFPTSRTRPQIYDRFLTLRTAMEVIGVSAVQWLGDEFTSNAVHPESLDVVSVVPAHEAYSLKEDRLATLFRFASRDAAHRVDGVCSPILLDAPANHPEREAFERAKVFWLMRLSRDVDGEPRGYIETTIDQGTQDAEK
ncbi:DUF6932 family protein [Burkholderia thailandensis]|uniref:DUF6932 family protein n=1 Tax=Burkholderia TaxID=32008 RepID=UPI0039B686CE